MNQVVILEGPDNAGKTTLADLFKTERGYRYFHEGPPPPADCALQYYAGKLLGYLRMKKPAVLDRFYLGEHVYGPVGRDHDRLGKRGLRMMDRLCRAYGVRQVICLPPWELVHAGYEAKLAQGDDYLRNEQKLWEVWNRYQAQLAFGGRWDFRRSLHYHHDWSKTRDQKSYDVLEAVENETILDSVLPFGAVGSPVAKLLLVGERSNTGLDLPFVALGNSSGYLDEAIQAAGIPEHDLALVNAYCPAIERLRPRGNQPRTKLLLDTINQLSCQRFGLPETSRFRVMPTIVALGKEAEVALRAAGTPADVVLPHPSQHKRFHYRKPEVFVEGLRNAYQMATR